MKGGSVLIVDLINLIGYAGVDIFFVISGFIMWVTTAHKVGQRDAFHFLIKRVIRIYSGYWPFFLLMCAFIAIAAPHKLATKDILGSALLINTDWRTNVVGVAWTLVFELYFYMIFTMLVWWLSPSKRAFGALGILAAIAVLQLSAPLIGYDNSRIVSWILGFFASWYCAEFFMGVLAGWLYSSTRFGASPLQAWLLVIFGMILMAVAVGYQAEYLGRVFDVTDLGVRVLVFGLASSALVLGLACIERVRGRRFHTVYDFLGGASYSIYLSHLLVIGILGEVFGLPELGLSVKLQMLITLVVVVGYSLIHYRWVERPLLSFCYAVVFRPRHVLFQGVNRE